MSLFKPVVILSILKNAPSQSENRKGFKVAWENAVSVEIHQELLL
jgi:hypothetical protein